MCPEVTTRISSIHIPSGKPTRTWDYATMLHPELAKQQVTSMCSREASTGVMPGDSATFIFLSVPVNRILGDSLSTGRYRVTVFPRIYFLLGVSAGEVDLRSPVDSSQSQMRGGR
ncbi:MAG: hypothetical protein ACJ794_12640 [Gemmatimonadaceae bacterium]